MAAMSQSTASRQKHSFAAFAAVYTYLRIDEFFVAIIVP